MLNCLLCSSCAACANICPHDAISMQLDADGFYRPFIDLNKCVHCGLCEKKCPNINIVNNPNLATIHPKTLAAYAKDENIRANSSSGGLFSVLAMRFLDECGVVIGVAQLSKNRFGHIIVEKKTDLEKLRGSKYVLADVGLIYRNVKLYLNAGRKVLFSGTPCQVAALYAVLGKNANSADLFTIDIVCHGAPSVKVFEKYIDYIEKRSSAQVLSTRFRDKRKGWNLNSLTMSLISKTGKFFQISETDEKNMYLRIFIQNLCLNTSCPSCLYSRLPRVADITLGDYWGVDKLHPEMYDDKGTSVVLINTDKGQQLIESAKNSINYCISDVFLATSSQKNINKPSVAHPQRDLFLKDLDKMTFAELYSKYCPTPFFFKRILNVVKKVLLKYL